MTLLSDMQDSYRILMDEIGETVTLRRNNPAPAAATEQTVKARVSGYQPEELVGGINQGDRKVIILAEDITTFPVPFKTGGTDKIIVRGKTLNIGVVDDSTRRIGDTLIAYEIRATG